METKFQTSFIPKKPLGGAGLPGAIPAGVVTSTPHRHVTSLFMTLALILFILSALAAGGAYGWKVYAGKQQVSYKKQLEERQRQFNVDLIEQLKQANVKIDTARTLLSGHLALSQIFDVISRFTIENVRFVSMDLSAPSAQSGNIRLSLRGYGSNFSAVAFQSDVLGQLEQYGLRKVVKNPIITDPTLDSNGTVSFGFSAVVDPGAMSYSRAANPPAEATSTPDQANQ